MCGRIGDIAGKGAFTHMADVRGRRRVDDILGVASPRIAEDHAVSRVTFTDPEVGSVGMTEAQAGRPASTCASASSDGLDVELAAGCTAPATKA